MSDIRKVNRDFRVIRREGEERERERWRYRGKMDDTAKRIISSLDGRWKETESGLTGTDRGLPERRRSTEWNPSLNFNAPQSIGV